MLAISILEIKDDLDKINQIDNLNPDYVHLDVMDGIFVPNTTDLSNLPKMKNKKDIHLMVSDIKKYVDIYKKYQPEFITFHLEATNDIESLIDYIHALGIKVGLSIKPNTDVLELTPYLDKVELILVMSVEPGKGKQPFMDSAISKVEKLDKLRFENNYKYLIEIDGGINPNTKVLVPKCDIFVVGSYITLSNDYKIAINSLK